MRWTAAPAELQPNASRALKVHLRDGSTVKLTRASVRADSVVGVPWGSTVSDARVAYARADIAYLEAGQTDVVASVGATVVIFLAVVGVLAVIALHTLHFD